MAGFDDKLDLAGAQNGHDSELLFLYRRYWRDVLSDHEALQETIDFWADQQWHGKLNPEGDLIYLSETNLKQYPTSGTEIRLGVDFVVDAFTDMQNLFTEARAMGRLVEKDSLPAIRRMEAERAWTSAHQAYNQYVIQMYDVLVSVWFKRVVGGGCQRRELEIKDFSSFTKQIMEFLIENNGRAFFTMSGLIASRFFSRMGSGLCIELSEDDHGDDSKKAEWLRDPNYEFYKSVAANHGFALDFNAPWRLVADISHPKMQEYMKKYGVTPANLFDKYYYRAFVHDIDIIKEVLLGWYNAYAGAYPWISTPLVAPDPPNPEAGQTSIRLTERRLLHPDDFMHKFSDEYWLELYYFVRLREIGADQDPAAFNRKFKKIIQVYKYFNLDKAKEYANILVKNTRTQHI